MNLNTNGLSQGFLAGFRTMADYQAQQKAEQRADESLQMQKDAAKDAKDFRDKTWDHSIAREGVQDARYEDEKNYNRDRQGKLDALSEKQINANISNENARTGIAQQQVDIQKQNADRQNKLADKQSQLTDMQITAAQQQQFTNDNWGVISGAYKNIQAGQPITEQQAQILNDPRAGAFNINKYTDQNYVDASKALQGNVQSLMTDFKPEQLHTPEFVNKLNSPEMKQNMGVVFKDDIKRGLGYTDPTNGKKVVDKEYAGMYPVESGGKSGLAIEVTPVYEDGTKGAPQPVTVNRSNDPNDKVQVFAPSDVVGVINSRANLSNAVKNPGSLLSDIKILPGPDLKGYAKSVADVDADTQKEIQQIRRNAAGSMASAAEIDSQIQDARAAGEQKKVSYKALYGLSDVVNPKPVADDSANKNQLAVTNWVGGDPGKQAFISKSVQTGHFDPNSGNTTALDAAYKQYQVELKNQSLENAIKNPPPANTPNQNNNSPLNTASQSQGTQPSSMSDLFR